MKHATGPLGRFIRFTHGRMVTPIFPRSPPETDPANPIIPPVLNKQGGCKYCNDEIILYPVPASIFINDPQVGNLVPEIPIMQSPKVIGYPHEHRGQDPEDPPCFPISFFEWVDHAAPYDALVKVEIIQRDPETTTW